MKTQKKLEPIMFILPFIALWAVFLAWPVLYGIILSLSKLEVSGSLRFIGFSNYMDLFREPRFWNAFKNTLVFALIVIPLIMGLGLLFAIVVWGWGDRRKGAGFIQSALFFPYLLTISIVSLTWLWLLDRDYGLVQHALRSIGFEAVSFLNNSKLVLPTLAFVTAWWLAGYRMLVFEAGLEDIPKELFDVAKIDGARPLQNFVNIVLPLLKPSLLFSLVLTIIAGFRTFGQVLVMTGGGPGRSSEVLALYMYRVGFEYFVPGKAAAAGVILLILIFIITLFGVRFIGLKSELQ